MKMNLDMSFEEGQKVIDALRECAMENGWNEDELDESGVIEEYSSAVDAALTAMGISVNITSEPESESESEPVEEYDDSDYTWDEGEEEEEEEDEEEEEEEEDEEMFGGYRIRLLKDGRRALIETDANAIMGIIQETVNENCPHYVESTRRDMICNIFQRFCEDMKIDLIIMGK